MLWLKAFHIIFVVTWFAGLFYLPRLFIYHQEATRPSEQQRFELMERRLLGITHIGGALAITFGLLLMIWFWHHSPSYLAQAHWFHVKLLLVALLVVYHALLIVMTRRLRLHTLGWSGRALRWFNEIPGLLLIGIVILVMVKPF